ncbi:SH3 domain-containing protein [Aliarcobacter butzleri]|uniref:SH3 domain-containing protein n=1 Tax=Aliarcobacter butzleri TaxID=28197 RepID=UPI0024DE76EB|nr:SH3 domain-containing protein [Aliarcobacter butzleri]MDK2065434.1 SH3 domain-containing protein [Aliarcobacter butzleri]
MKDYLKEMEYTLNPMKRIYEEINPMKNLMDSMKSINTFENLYSNSTMSAIIEAQKEMEYTLNPMKRIYEEMNPMKNLMDSMKSINTFENLYSNSTISSIIEAQKEMEYTLNPLKKLYDEVNSNFIHINQLKSIDPKISLASLNSLISILKIEELNEILKSLNLSHMTVEETIQNKLEEQIDSLTQEDKKSLDEAIDSLKYMFPDISYITEKFSNKEYIAIIIYIILSIPTIYSFYEEHFKQMTNYDSYYKINRNNVRVRTEPSTDNNSTIIMKLNKNILVEKIDSHKNWLKVEFEDDDGEDKQGWIRRDMLTKIENE